jgi:uncharacterized membrane protein
MNMPRLSPPAKSVALFVSLAANVLLVSAIATQALSSGKFDNRDRSTASRVERLADRLPGPDGAKLKAAFAAHAADLPAAHTDLKAARDAFRQALAANPYDPAAVEKSLAALDASRARVRQIMRATIVSAVAEMSPDGRKSLADRTQRPSRDRKEK